MSRDSGGEPARPTRQCCGPAATERRARSLLALLVVSTVAAATAAAGVLADAAVAGFVASHG
jgi:hypothetical protein